MASYESTVSGRTMRYINELYTAVGDDGITTELLRHVATRIEPFYAPALELSIEEQ